MLIHLKRQMIMSTITLNLQTKLKSGHCRKQLIIRGLPIRVHEPLNESYACDAQCCSPLLYSIVYLFVFSFSNGKVSICTHMLILLQQHSIFTIHHTHMVRMESGNVCTHFNLSMPKNGNLQRFNYVIAAHKRRFNTDVQTVTKKYICCQTQPFVRIIYTNRH